jgi:hypothetical protein
MGATATAPDAGWGRWRPGTATANSLGLSLSSGVKSELCVEKEMPAEANRFSRWPQWMS